MSRRQNQTRPTTPLPPIRTAASSAEPSLESRISQLEIEVSAIREALSDQDLRIGGSWSNVSQPHPRAVAANQWMVALELKRFRRAEEAETEWQKSKHRTGRPGRPTTGGRQLRSWMIELGKTGPIETTLREQARVLRSRLQTEAPVLNITMKAAENAIRSIYNQAKAAKAKAAPVRRASPRRI